jgi:hypothetical protein
LAVAALRVHPVPHRKPGRLLFPLARIRPWILAVGVAGYLGLLPGIVLLYYFTGVANDTLAYALMFVSFTGLILSLVAALAADGNIEA